MVFRLHNYIFRELFKVLAPALVGLTLISSLSGVLQPAQEYGLAPLQVVHVLLYFMPVTLMFVVPMAALFASALTYGRLASDNEMDACRACGIGMLTLVYPGLTLAILVAITNLMLSFHIVPNFVHLAEKSFKADAEQILFRNIQRNGFYALPPQAEYLIYADYVNPREGILNGIVVVQNDEAAVKKILIASRARIRIDPHDRFNEVRLDAHGVRQMAGAGDFWFTIEETSVSFQFGSLLGDEIKFKKLDEMKEIRADPTRFDPIAKIALRTLSQLAIELLAQDISGTIRSPNAGFYELRGSTRFVRISASSCVLEKDAQIGLPGPVSVEEYDSQSGTHLRTLRCDGATIYVHKDAEAPRLDLYLKNARVEATQQLMLHHSITDLALPGPLAERLSRVPLLDAALPEATASILKGPPSLMLAAQQRALAQEIRRALVHIKSEIHSRLVLGLGCIPMILIGIGLGIINRDGHLLSAFGASCVPAALLIVAIMSGKQITENTTAQGISGILIMWAGLAGLTALAILMYARLSRR